MKLTTAVVLAACLLRLSADNACAADRSPVARLTDKLNAGIRPEKLTPATVNAIFNLMDDRTKAVGSSLGQIPQLMFGEIYDPGLADLVMCLPDSGDAPAIALVQGGRTKRELFGQKYVWALLFWKRDADSSATVQVVDSVTATLGGLKPASTFSHTRTISRKWPPNRVEEEVASLVDTALAARPRFVPPGSSVRHDFGYSAATPEPDSAKFRLEPLVYEEASVDRSLLGSLLSVLNFGDKKEAEKVQDEETKAQTFVLGQSGTRELLCSVEKFTIRENSINRIKGEAESKKEYATFGNYDASRYGVGVGFLATKEDSAEAKHTAIVPRPFVYLHYYARRPRLPKLPQGGPLHSISCRLTLGTEFNTKFERWYGGIGFGNVIGRLGLTTGVRLNVRRRNPWQGRTFAWGLDYTL